MGRASARLHGDVMTVIPFIHPADANKVVHLPLETAAKPKAKLPSGAKGRQTAVVFCEGNFGRVDGKTANGLVRHSEKYQILSVIDTTKAGMDSGDVLGEKPNGIPVYESLGEAVANAPSIPDFFIYGVAPATGMLSVVEREIILDAMAFGINIVNGLHEFLNDDAEFAAASLANNVTIIDIRKPRPKNELRLFNGSINSVSCPKIAVLGTDCAIGKRTTASILTRALIERGIKATMVTTGQTGMIQGSAHGVALDAVPSQFCCGELEATIVGAFEDDAPDVIIVEGQGALSHPAFCTSAFILRGSVPDGVILQHAPKRAHRCDFEDLMMPTPQSEIKLIEAFADTKVIGLTINHEDMSEAEIDTAITHYGETIGIPVTDALARPVDRLVEMVVASFPELRAKLSDSTQ